MNHREKSWKAALIDLDGTLYRGHQRVEGAPEFVERLRERGVQPIFFTNNATRTPVKVVQHLENMGIDAYPHEVCTAAQAAADYLRRTTPSGGYILSIGQEGLLEALRLEGLQALSIRHPKVVERLCQVTGAVIGLDPHITYSELAVFCQKVAELGAFTLTNPDVRLPVENGFIPGNGAVGALVETASLVHPYVAGKPNGDFVEYALKKYGITADEAIVIGDNLSTDVACGIASGVYTVQVLSGVDKDGTGDRAANEVAPSVADLF